MQHLTRDVCKTLCPLKCFFVIDVLYTWISQFKSCTMKKKFISGNCYLIWNGFDTVDLCDFVWLDLWPSDPKINMVLLLPRVVVCTKSEEGRSWRSWVIGRKWKGYRWTYRQTDRQTDRPTDRLTDQLTDWHVQSNMPCLLGRGHNDYNMFYTWYQWLSAFHVYPFYDWLYI